jgi:hypothetical protein
MTLRLTLSSYGSSTLEIGLVVHDDGHVTGYQTSGWRVGRFARDLKAKERTALERALESARSATALEPAATTRPPSGSMEQLVADGLPDATFASNASPPPGFEGLVRVLRGVREDLADFPAAAIELEVIGTPLRARLHHVGTEPIGVRAAGELRIEALVYDKDYLILEREIHTVDPGGLDGAVSAGWELGLVDQLALATPPRGGFLSVTVGPLRVDSVGDGVLRQTEFSWGSE